MDKNNLTKLEIYYSLIVIPCNYDKEVTITIWSFSLFTLDCFTQI